jgi:hypothetical protein
MLSRRMGSVVGFTQRVLALRDTAAVRLMSTVATATASAWKPSIIFAKVGADGKYVDLTIEWGQLASLREAGLLEVLAGSRMFIGKLGSVDLNDCTVSIRKAALADAGAAAALPRGTSAELKLGETVGGKVQGSSTGGGDLLLIDVHLPERHVAKLAADAAKMAADAAIVAIATGASLHAAARCERVCVRPFDDRAAIACARR